MKRLKLSEKQLDNIAKAVGKNTRDSIQNEMNAHSLILVKGANMSGGDYTNVRNILSFETMEETLRHVENNAVRSVNKRQIPSFLHESVETIVDFTNVWLEANPEKSISGVVFSHIAKQVVDCCDSLTEGEKKVYRERKDFGTFCRFLYFQVIQDPDWRKIKGHKSAIRKVSVTTELNLEGISQSVKFSIPMPILDSIEKGKKRINNLIIGSNTSGSPPEFTHTQLDDLSKAGKSTIRSFFREIHGKELNENDFINFAKQNKIFVGRMIKIIATTEQQIDGKWLWKRNLTA
eukprot:Lithocolla_globosa_v1_NODE_1882_length_2277_cov_16.628713.p1 type:complete len:291 gc:universal NODE_1882_length_2277_cov_16.628713:1412-540(-)